MKLKLYAFAFAATCSMLLQAQQSYMASADVAVFYPAGYDAAAHSPSPIFIRELAPQGAVSPAWKLRPAFSTEDGKSVVRIKADADADLYGGGEVWGPLRRNGKTIAARPSNFGMSIRLAMAWMAVLIFIRVTLGFSVFAATVQALALLPIIRGRRR